MQEVSKGDKGIHAPINTSDLKVQDARDKVVDLGKPSSSGEKGGTKRQLQLDYPPLGQSAAEQASKNKGKEPVCGEPPVWANLFAGNRKACNGLSFILYTSCYC